MRRSRSLAARTGFQIVRVVFDSTSFQFWASRAYRRGETLTAVLPAPLTLRWLALIASNVPDALRAAVLNARGRGDQAAFVLRPAVNA